MPSPQELAKKMGEVKFFNRLSPSDLLRVITAGNIRHATVDEILFHEDEPCAGLFVLLKGQAHLKKFGPEGQQNIVHVIEAVFAFNEVSVADGGLNPVTAVASQSSLLWHISYDDFHHLIGIYPQLALALLQILATHNRLLLSEYEDVCFLPVRARLAKLLLEASDQGENIIYRKDLSIQQTAARISTAPELVSRALGYMKNNGYIESSRAEIKIKSTQALAQIAKLNAEFKNN